MWLALSIILLSSLRASADFANPAPGIITWCNYSEPSYAPSDLTRITRGTRGAWACLGPYGNNPPQQNLDYTGCPVSCDGNDGLRSGALRFEGELARCAGNWDPGPCTGVLRQYQATRTCDAMAS
eukprot:gene10825-16911_t